MKVFCMYVVIDIKTGFELACGRKYKDFENSPIRYIYDCDRRDFPRFWRKYPCYYRTVEIKGRQCLIYYWTERDKRELDNFVFSFGNKYFLNGHSFFDDAEDYSELVSDLGVR